MNRMEIRLFVAAMLAALATLAGLYLSIITNPHGFIAFSGFEISLIVGIIGLLYGPVRRQGILFFIMCVSISGYSLLLFAQYVCVSAQQVRLIALTAGIGYMLLPAAGMHFSFVFFGLERLRHRIAIGFGWIVSALFYVAMLTGLMPLEYTRSGVKFALDMSPAYLAQLSFTGAALVYLFAELILLFASLKQGFRKTQLIWFLCSSLAAMLLGYTNPMTALGVPGYPLGGLALAFLSAVLAYLIVKHRFLDIQFVLRKTFFWVLWTSSVAAVYIGALACFGLFGYAGTFETGAWNFAAMLVAAMSLLPLRNAVQNLVDRRFFRRSFDARKTIEDLSARIIEILSVEGLSREVTETVVSTFSAEGGYILLPGPDRTFALAAQKEQGRQFVYFEEDSRNTKITGSGWRGFPRRFEPSSADADDLPPDSAEFVRSRRIEACIPLPSGDGVAGLLMMGAKKSELAYTDEDMHLLATIANQAAVAFSNANYYEQVLASKNYIEDVIESMEGGLLTVDRECRLVTTNDSARSVFGIVPGEDGSPLCGSGHCAAIMERLESVLSGGVGSSDEELKVDGRILSLSTSLIKDHRGKVAGALASFLDVTERENMKADLELKKRLALIGEMAARIAHEIKNPLNSILTRVGQVEKRLHDVAFMKQFQDVVPSEIRRLESIANGLLRYSKPLDPLPGRVDSRRIVNSAIDALSGELEAGGILTERRISADIEPMVMDGELFKQVVVNLVKNAAEAPANSELKTIRVTLEPLSSGGIVLEVADNGAGISGEDLPRIFNPFFSTKTCGTGLGLATVAKIVEVHKGRVTVDSEPGKGARFKIEIPADGLGKGLRN